MHGNRKGSRETITLSCNHYIRQGNVIKQHTHAHTHTHMCVCSCVRVIDMIYWYRLGQILDSKMHLLQMRTTDLLPFRAQCHCGRMWGNCAALELMQCTHTIMCTCANVMISWCIGLHWCTENYMGMEQIEMALFLIFPVCVLYAIL